MMNPIHSIAAIATSLLALSPLVSAAPAQPELESRLQSRAGTFYQGFDLSSLHILEQANISFRSTAQHNATMPAEDILMASGGMNTVRLRLWVNPPKGQYDLAYVLSQAQRFAAKGLHVYLDMHFADSWADPGKQPTPAAWSKTSLSTLSSQLRSYVSSTLQSFHKAGVDPAIVSLGNEIRNGMLWPLGAANPTLSSDSARAANFTNVATLYAAARAGVSDAVAAGAHQPQVMIHIDNGWDKTLQLNWFAALVGTGKVKTSDWDVFGFSFYPFYGTSATLANLASSLAAISSKYSKPVQVVETDWPERCDGSGAPQLSEPSIPASAAGQIEWVRDIVKTVKAVPGGYGQGVNYWEPTWLNNTGLGSACQDAILFDGDWSQYPNSVVGYSRSSVSMFTN